MKRLALSRFLVAVLVDALSAGNAAFYQTHGFLPVPGAASKLYLSAANLLALAGTDVPAPD